MPAFRKTLRRFEEPGHARFLTFSCYKCQPFFHNNKIASVFVDRLSMVTMQFPVPLIAWVVMPEHVHLLVMPDVTQISMTRYLQALKRPVSAQVLKRWRELNAPVLARITDSHGRTHFWQTGGGYDRNIYTDDELHEKTKYIHANPVTRGLTDTEVEYAWSSARHYADLEYDGPMISPIGA